MRELQSRLADRETATTLEFDALNNRVRCYAHIINICSSHIIASLTSTTSCNPSDFDVPRCDSDSGSNSDDEVDDYDVNPVRLDRLALTESYDVEGNHGLRKWLKDMQRNPLGRARKIICLLRSSDQRRQGFQDFIKDGNEHGWFTYKDDDGSVVVTKVPELELLRDVKTRWDSSYLMLRRLRDLRLVSPSQWTDLRYRLNI